jgi:two-component system, response regulator RegA
MPAWTARASQTASKDETSIAPGRLGADSRKVPLVDDDAPLRKNLMRAFECDGFDVATAGSLKGAHDVAAEFGPGFAVLDLNLQDGYGMELMAVLQERRPGVRIVIITGYDTIASSLVALEARAVGYLAKPVRAEDVVATLLGQNLEGEEAAERPMSADRVRWEHIHQVFEQCNRNVSETARRLCTGARSSASCPSGRRGHDGPRLGQNRAAGASQVGRQSAWDSLTTASLRLVMSGNKSSPRPGPGGGAIMPSITSGKAVTSSLYQPV